MTSAGSGASVEDAGLCAAAEEPSSVSLGSSRRDGAEEVAGVEEEAGFDLASVFFLT